MTDPPTADPGPGFYAFVGFFLLALVLWFLMRNMNARMRRMSYRQQQAHRGRDEPQAVEGEGPIAAAPDPDAPTDPGPDRGAGPPAGPR